MTDARPEPERLYVSPQEFAELSGLSLSTVHRYLKSGRIEFVQPGGPRSRILISRHALQKKTPEADKGGTPGDSTSADTDKQPVSGPRPRWMKKNP